MLVYDKKLLKVTRLNELVFPIYESTDPNMEGDPIGYIYSDLATYQQMVTLAVRFEGDVTQLENLLLQTKRHKEAIDFWTSNVPTPFNMVGPYLGLVTDGIAMNNDLEELTSYLHVVGRSVDFASFIAIPVAARVNVSFGKSSFLMMKAEIADYKRQLRSREKDEEPTDVTWVSTEEIERVLKVAEQLTVLGLAGGSSTATTTSTTTSSNDGDVDLEIDEDDDWSGYVPPAYTPIDYGTTSSAMTTKAIEDIKHEAAADSEESGEEQANENDMLDMIMSGTENSFNV